MKSKIWIPCLVVIVMVLGLLLRARQTAESNRQGAKNAKAGENGTSVPTEAGRGTDVAPPSSSRGSGLPGATGSAGSAGHQRELEARATASGRDARLTAPTGLEPVTGEELEAAVATIQVGGQTYRERSNEYGVFPELRIEPRQQVGIAVAFAQGDAGQRVVAMGEDGGVLRDGERVLPMQLDANRHVAFHFTAGHERGVYRIRLQRGTETKVLQFWAGEPLALASR